MSTVASLKNRVGRMLSDVTLDGYDDSLFYDGVGAALDAILPWVPKALKVTITGDGTSSYPLPNDLYHIEAVSDDATGQLLREAQLVSGRFRGENIAAENDWLEYPHGHISFSKNISVGETYTLYYLAHWGKPIDDDDLTDPLEPPSYTHFALALYTTAYMIFPSAVSASEVRQFNTRVDSGNPEHNPMQQSATYLLKLFAEEMNRHPRHQKAQR